MNKRPLRCAIICVGDIYVKCTPSLHLHRSAPLTPLFRPCVQVPPVHGPAPWAARLVRRRADLRARRHHPGGRYTVLDTIATFNWLETYFCQESIFCAIILVSPTQNSILILSNCLMNRNGGQPMHLIGRHGTRWIQGSRDSAFHTICNTRISKSRATRLCGEKYFNLLSCYTAVLRILNCWDSQYSLTQFEWSYRYGAAKWYFELQEQIRTKLIMQTLLALKYLI